MNLSLVDPFIIAQDYPDALTGKLSAFRALLYLCPILTLTLF